MYSKTRFFVVAGVATAFCAQAQATVLTFADLNLINYGDIPNTYGDNVTGPGAFPNGTYGMGNGWTPNITTDYRSTTPGGVTTTTHLDYWSTGYGDLIDVAFVPTNGDYAHLILTPSAGWDVRVNSFDLAAWGGAPIDAL